MRSVQCCRKWLVLVSVCVRRRGSQRVRVQWCMGQKRGGGGGDRRELSFLTAWCMKLSFSLLVLTWRLCSLLPDGSRLKKLCDGWVGSEGFAGEMGAVDVLEGEERDTNNLLSCSHYSLKGLAAGRVAGAIPHSDAASQDALDGASVKGAHDGGRGSGSSEFAVEVETLLCCAKQYLNYGKYCIK